MYLRASGDAPQTEIGRILQRRDDVYTWKMSYEAWQTFQDLREKGLFYDVSLVSDEGERLDAHRIVLCACGQYFRALFSGRWKSSEQQTITINGVKSRVLGKIIDFAYTRQILLHSVFETKELLIAGSHFGIEEMTKTCTNYLVAELNFANSLDLWIFAKTYYCEDLQSRVLSFILDNFEAIVRASSSGSGKSIHHLDGDHLGQILESDELNVDSERSAIHVILKWLELASPKERNSHLLRLFSSVRLKFLNPSYLSSLLQKYGNVISECGFTGSLIEHHISLSKVGLITNDNARPFSGMFAKGDAKQLGHGTSCNVGMDAIMRSSRPRHPREVLLVVGGWSGKEPTASSEAFDPATKVWSNTKSTFHKLLEKPRAYHGVSFLGGYVFVVGGFDGHTTYNSCDRYCIRTGTWKKMCGMRHRRCYVGVSELEGQIYAVGGSDGGDVQPVRLKSAERFDPGSNVWTSLPDMIERRSDAGVCGMDKRLYVAGGFTGQLCVFSVEYFDLQTREWCRVNPMGIRRSGVTAIAYKKRVLVMGGFDGVHDRLNSVEAFDPAENRWTQLPNMLTGRSNFGACILRGRLHVMGGFNGATTCANVEYLQDRLEDDQVDSITSANSDISPVVWNRLPDMNVARSALSCCVLKDLPPAFLRFVAPAGRCRRSDGLGDQSWTG